MAPSYLSESLHPVTLVLSTPYLLIGFISLLSLTTGRKECSGLFPFLYPKVEIRASGNMVEEAPWGGQGTACQQHKNDLLPPLVQRGADPQEDAACLQQ